MTAQSMVSLVLVGGGLVVVVWLLHKLGRALASFAEAVVTLATLGVALWLLVKAVFVMVKAAVTHPRTSLSVGLVVGWLLWWGWPSLVGGVVVVVAGLAVWRWRHWTSFEAWAGRWLRSWWL